MIELRDYQVKLINETREAYRRGARAVLISLVPGGGKTITASHIVHGAATKGNVCWWLTHRKELIRQTSNTFHNFGVPHSTIRAGYVEDRQAKVQVASIQTIIRQLERLPEPDLICFDETHHIGANSWDAIFRRFPGAKVLGLTGTPWRLDGQGLGRWYDAMVSGPTPGELIEHGSLSRYRLFAPSQPDLSDVATQAGDYQRASLARAMDKPAIVGDAIGHYQRLCPGKRAIVFAVSVEHSRNVAAQFCAAGISAEHVDGTTPEHERDGAFQRFERGETLVISNVDIAGEGLDIPAIEAVIMLRPTKSLSLVKQQTARALRPFPGKEHAIILDHAGNTLVHGLPDDDVQWSLEDREKRKSKAGDVSPVRQCTECFFVYRPAPVCPQCGHRPVAPVREIEQVDGVLEEVKRVSVERRREQGRAQTFEELQAFAAAKGYRAGWAHRVWAARQAKVAA